jgi:hypothetical protein
MNKYLTRNIYLAIGSDRCTATMQVQDAPLAIIIYYHF